MRIQSQLQPFAIISVAILSACVGGQGGDPGQTTGGMGGIGGIGEDAGGTGGMGTGGQDHAVDPDDCSGERWAGPDAPFLSGTCTRSAPGSELFRCECIANGESDTRDVSAERCWLALRDACAINLQTPSYCTANGIGTCFPTDEDETWSCQCAGSDELLETDAAVCQTALSLHCTQSCESAFGSCRQALVSPDAYGCVCTDPSSPTGHTGGETPNPAPRFGYASCGEALADQCGEACGDPMHGECVFSGEDAFDCMCSDGEPVRVPLDSVGGAGIDACWTGVERACGEALYPPLSDCEASYDGHDASCEAFPLIVKPGEPVPTLWSFSCACDGDDAEPAQALTCNRALQASCPDAIPPSAVPAPERELGALCQTASDCNPGACFVPGTRTDAICSAPCETDDDCPPHALCAFLDFIDPPQALCFVACESDVECGLLNDAQQNPLACQDRGDIDGHDLSGGRICIQSSEP